MRRVADHTVPPVADHPSLISLCWSPGVNAEYSPCYFALVIIVVQNVQPFIIPTLPHTIKPSYSALSSHAYLAAPPNFLLTKHIFLPYKGNSYYTELKKKKASNIAKQSNFIIFFLLSQKGIYIKVIILLETSRVTIIETELVGRGKAGKYKKYIFFQLGERLKMVQVIAYIWDFSIRAGMKSIVQRFTSLVLFYKFVKIYLVVNEARHLQYTRIIC